MRYIKTIGSALAVALNAVIVATLAAIILIVFGACWIIKRVRSA